MITELLISRVAKYFALFNLGKMSSTFGIGQVNFLVILFKCLVVNDQSLSSVSSLELQL